MVDIKKMKKKICLLGDAAVGKTSLIRRYVFNEFDDKYIMTLGAKVSKKDINLEYTKDVGKIIHVNVVLSIWDILGQRDESSRRVRPVYFKGSSGALLVCDITRQSTFNNLAIWIKAFFQVTKEVPIVVLGNKIDLYKEAEVYYEDLEKFSKDYNIPVFITSARTNSNVDRAFYKLSEMMVDQYISDAC